MDIINNSKIELTCDDYKLDYILAVYDIYGHYIDEVKLTREDISELYHALEKLGL